MRKECSLYYLAFACFGMFGASQSKQASKTQQQWNIEALSKGATHIGEDRVGHSLDTSLLPCRLQQHNGLCSTKGPRYAKNLSYQTDSHGLAHSAGKTRNHNFILHMQYFVHSLYYFCWLISIGTLFWATAWALIKTQGESSKANPRVRSLRCMCHVAIDGMVVVTFCHFHCSCKCCVLNLFGSYCLTWSEDIWSAFYRSIDVASQGCSWYCCSTGGTADCILLCHALSKFVDHGFRAFAQQASDLIAKVDHELDQSQCKAAWYQFDDGLFLKLLVTWLWLKWECHRIIGHHRAKTWQNGV